MNIHKLAKGHSFIYPYVNGQSVGKDCHDGFTDKSSEAFVGSTESGVVISYLVYNLVPGQYVKILFSGTNPKYRKQGLNTLLRRYLLRQARASQCKIVLSECNAVSASLMKTKLGFTVLDRVKNFEPYDVEANCFLELQ